MPRNLTARQSEVLWLRDQRGATLQQIAAWLNISRRAVLYRLRNARMRAGMPGHSPAAPGPGNDPDRPKPAGSSRQRRRVFSASQLSAVQKRNAMDVNEL